jgi:hypothetical protein
MISVTVEMREKAVCLRVRVTAPSIEQALALAGVGKPGKVVRVVFPIDPEAFFVGSKTPAGTSSVASEHVEAA